MPRGGARPNTGPKPSVEKIADKAVRDLIDQKWLEIAEKKAIPLIEELLTDKKAPMEQRLKAAKEVLDRAYGKPVQPIGGPGENGEFIFQWQK